MEVWESYLSEHNGKVPRNAFDLVNFSRSIDSTLTFQQAKELYAENVRNDVTTLNISASSNISLTTDSDDSDGDGPRILYSPKRTRTNSIRRHSSIKLKKRKSKQRTLSSRINMRHSKSSRHFRTQSKDSKLSKSSTKLSNKLNFDTGNEHIDNSDDSLQFDRFDPAQNTDSDSDSLPTSAPMINKSRSTDLVNSIRLRRKGKKSKKASKVGIIRENKQKKMKKRKSAQTAEKSSDSFGCASLNESDEDGHSSSSSTCDDDALSLHKRFKHKRHKSERQSQLLSKRKHRTKGLKRDKLKKNKLQIIGDSPNDHKVRENSKKERKHRHITGNQNMKTKRSASADPRSIMLQHTTKSGIKRRKKMKPPPSKHRNNNRKSKSNTLFVEHHNTKQRHNSNVYPMSKKQIRSTTDSEGKKRKAKRIKFRVGDIVEVVLKIGDAKKSDLARIRYYGLTVLDSRPLFGIESFKFSTVY